MLLAVIVELADAHLRHLVLSGVGPYPFGVDLVLLGNLLGGIVFRYLEVLLRDHPFIGLAFEHELDVGPSYQRHLPAEPRCAELLLLDQFVDVLAAYTHQPCSLRKGEVFLLLQRRAQFQHLLHVAQLHLPLHHAVFVTPFRALRAAITGRRFLGDEGLPAPLTNPFYLHIFSLFSIVFHKS